MLSRTASMHTCGGFYARLACSSHTKSHLVAFQERLVRLVNFINEDESAILLPMKTRSFKICLRKISEKDDLLVSDLVAKDEAENSGQQDTYGGLNHIQHIHKWGYTANCL